MIKLNFTLNSSSSNPFSNSSKQTHSLGMSILKLAIDRTDVTLLNYWRESMAIMYLLFLQIIQVYEYLISLLGQKSHDDGYFNYNIKSNIIQLIYYFN